MNHTPADQNPFASHRVERLLFRQAGFSWATLLRRLESLNLHASIVGPKGSGKTTLLSELGDRLSSTGMKVVTVTVRAEDHQPRRAALKQLGHDLGTASIILLDGAEQLGAMSWRLFLFHTRDRRGLVVTSHRHGRLAPLFECDTSPALLGDLVAELCPCAAYRYSDDLPDLWQRHGGNIRLCLRELYDRAVSHPGEPSE